MRNKLVALAVTPLLFLAACGDDKTSDTTSPGQSSTTSSMPVLFSLTDSLASQTKYSTLVQALHVTGLDAIFDSTAAYPHYTIFAPTNDAFDKLPNGVLEKLLLTKNKAKLIAILRFHVLAERILEKDISSGRLSTLEGEDLVVEHKPQVYVNDAKVSSTDQLAANGVIHEIDKVLVPASINIDTL
jgi:uncharacterized surface protein with fasciclin (FAS1) repeats